MSITGKINDRIDNFAKNATVAKAQLDQLREKQKDYLSSKEVGDETLIQRNLGAISLEVTRSYLPQIQSLYAPIPLYGKGFDPHTQVCFFDITKWVCDPKEQNIEKLANVYQVLAEEPCAIALMFRRCTDRCYVTMAVANQSGSAQPGSLKTFEKRLTSAIRGNFQGAELSESKTGIPDALKCFIPEKDPCTCAIAAVTNLATEKSEDFISQSIEKLLDGIIPQSEEEEYTIVLLAQACQNKELHKLRLCELYTQLSPFASWQSNKGLNISDSASAMVNVGANVGVNIGVNMGVNYGKSYSDVHQVGTSEGVTHTFTNYAVKHTLDALEEQIKRLDQCAALGMWDFAAYVISESVVTAKNVAHMYLSLTQGEKSYISQAAVNVWESRDATKKTDDDDAPVTEAQSVENPTDVLLEYLQGLQHPIFALKNGLDGDWLTYPTQTTATTSISGSELAHALNFPQKSVSGLPVFQCVPFGRDVMYLNQDTAKGDVRLGSIYHMKKEDKIPVHLDRNSLTAHTFITGSTGAGKSNVVYTLLDGLCHPAEKGGDTTFLVIEPAKGEYKDVFGGYESVSVYGTNGRKIPLLRLNPFSFPSDIHVLEHVDRLTEVFNACWPMSAAMPAVLKDALLQAYQVCGWDLAASENTVAPGLFPSFQDLQEELVNVIEDSAYSRDLKSDYMGSLGTRVKSLTNGLNGQIFSANEISNADLFDKNVVVDLSRVGSSETKALLMGVLMIKLQEYRMATPTPNNAGLRHVTVLEEAHNLLRRTSTEQSQDSSNLQGKAVEMLTNAIAEMRTYGEGFIIADQSPGLLDMAAIRNTNTKIILRLPDENDRQLVGKAAGLNDNQIVELAKLDTGVAAVSQNHWLEPVLCKVSRFDHESPYQGGGEKAANKHDSHWFDRELLKLLLNKRIPLQVEQGLDIGRLEKELPTAPLSSKHKLEVARLIQEYKGTGTLELWDKKHFDRLSGLVVKLLGCGSQTRRLILGAETFEQLDRQLTELIEAHAGAVSTHLRLAACQCILKDFSMAYPEKLTIYQNWREFAIKVVKR